MAIWHVTLSLEALNRRSENTMASTLGILFTEIGDDYLKASMPVNHNTKQPIGLLHGGANCALAETVASTAANCVIDTKTSYGVGLEINANHIRSAKEGIVIATSKPFHIGRTTQVWHTEILDEAGRLICTSRMTVAIIQR
jgi:1,4-dihydroxy-2-naphthoyl-CoA hydrolase